jgi:hypothetical protein
MQLIPLDQLEKMFAAMRTEDNSIDGEMQWCYYFTAKEKTALEPLAQALNELGFGLSGIMESDEEPLSIVQAERFEKQTPETLYKTNAALEILAGRFPGVEYDGMDVNSGEDETGETLPENFDAQLLTYKAQQDAFEQTLTEEAPGCCCGGHAEGDEPHECCGGHAKGDEPHECCGGHAKGDEPHECCGGHAKGDEPHECCGGHAKGDEPHKCCGGHGGSGCRG